MEKQNVSSLTKIRTITRLERDFKTPADIFTHTISQDYRAKINRFIHYPDINI
jgi:hypothetical protein